MNVAILRSDLGSILVYPNAFILFKKRLLSENMLLKKGVWARLGEWWTNDQVVLSRDRGGNKTLTSWRDGRNVVFQ